MSRSANLPIIKGACENNGWGPKNSDIETQTIKSSIEDEAKASNIPPELILAVMMQESRGCVRAPTTHFGLHNPGLMQSAGDATCESTTPCPGQEITQMIHEGTAGEGLPMTLKKSLNFFEAKGVTDDSRWYKAARRYNAGPQITDTNLGVSSTGCYASDIANRLIHPFLESSCDDGVVATLQGTAGLASNGDEDDTQEIGLEQPQLSNDKPDSTTNGPKSKAEDAQGGDAGPNGPIVEGAVGHCTQWYTPTRDSSCADAPVNFTMLRSLNTGLDEGCSNLLTGYAYCVGTSI
jgi:hypothetical protein